jgi:cytochrome c oxidase subunit 4
MENNTQHHIVKYSTYFYVLLALLAFTTISVSVTHYSVGHFTVAVALILASAKSGLVLWHFMHLKYENKFFIIMIAMVLFIFIAVLIVTFLDYSFR